VACTKVKFEKADLPFAGAKAQDEDAERHVARARAGGETSEAGRADANTG
jgi:poly-gamma-glutamate capsule biosynthesis protein CapA/YwtB (metallophosphatase superfamily)